MFVNAGDFALVQKRAASKVATFMWENMAKHCQAQSVHPALQEVVV